MSTPLFAAPLVDWGAIGQIVVIGLLVGVGCVAAFAVLVRTSIDVEVARSRGATAVAPLAVTIACGAILLAAAGVGIHAMLAK